MNNDVVTFTVLWSKSQPRPGDVLLFHVIDEDRLYDEQGSVHSSQYTVKMVTEGCGLKWPFR